uniref:Uncharacterized protein n=1 Tax=Oncorhynchus kisutch TaxID=8019 RepID=A0A8C7L8Z1_ONCKI
IGMGILHLIIMDPANNEETHPLNDNEAMKTSVKKKKLVYFKTQPYQKFSEPNLKSGMFRDNSFNTSIEKSKRPETIPMFQDRINFHYANDNGNGQNN